MTLARKEAQLHHNECFQQVEGKEMLRVRTKQVFDLLKTSSHRVICIVTHKGYLRELERGYLGQPRATEFQNCEVRVYRVNLSAESAVPTRVERLHPPVSD